MQKVSKQSLAMLALSILLAISIALTFTFAALTDSKKATGTITFSGNVALEMECGIGSPTGTGTTTDPFVFTYQVNGQTSAAATVTAINAELANVTFGLADASNDAYIQVKVTATAGGTAIVLADGTKDTAFGNKVGELGTGAVYTTTDVTTKDSSYNLGQFVQVSSINFATISNSDTIKITLEVKAALNKTDVIIA